MSWHCRQLIGMPVASTYDTHTYLAMRCSWLALQRVTGDLEDLAVEAGDALQAGDRLEQEEQREEEKEQETTIVRGLET